jgi:hypothetical protein
MNLQDFPTHNLFKPQINTHFVLKIKFPKSTLHHRNEIFLHQGWLIFFPMGTY